MDEKPTELVIHRRDLKTPPKTQTVGLRPFVKPDALHARPADLIEIDRTLFSEWGLYIGKGELVLLDGDLTGRETRTKVVKRKLADLGNALVRVNNKKVPAKHRGVVALKSKTVIQNVSKLLGKTVEYNILTRNSEHYVTEWKFGHSWSDQSKAAIQSMSIFSTPPSPKEVDGAHETLSQSLKRILTTQTSMDLQDENSRSSLMEDQ